jgi:4-amino-4-deoxy-L-arabinose transferase-like glycosyltransferase
VVESSQRQAVSPYGLFILLGLCFLFFFWRLGRTPFYERGEPREGMVVEAMYASGNWILPKVNGEYIPFKPPLFHWFAAIAANCFGRVDEFTVRFPSALFASLGVLVTYFAGTRFWGEESGLLGGLFLATNSDWWYAGTLAQVDMTLTFFITAACLYFYFLYRQQSFGRVRALMLPALLGLATVAKGPIGVVLPSIIFLVFLGVRRDFSFVKKLRPISGSIVFLLVAGSWYSLAVWQGGMSFVGRQLIDETLLTAVGSYGHYQPIYYFVVILLQQLAPWSFFLPVIAIYFYQYRHRLHEKHLLFPLLWLLLVLLFFSLARGKRAVYVLPLYPAVALLFAAFWSDLEKGLVHGVWGARTIGYFVAGSSLVIIVAVAVVAAGKAGWIDGRLLAPVTQFKVMADILPLFTPSSPWLWLSLMLHGAGACLLLVALRRNRWRPAFIAMVIIASGTTMFLKNSFWPTIADERTLKPFMARVTQRVASTDSLVFYRTFEYGATFYAHRHVPFNVIEISDMKPPFYLLMWEEEWKNIKGHNEFHVVDISEGRGAVGKHRMVLVIRQPTS